MNIQTFAIIAYVLCIVRLYAFDYVNITQPGNCRKIWRPDSLPGKCFGLDSSVDIQELKSLGNIRSARDCRALCCNLGATCITWQYQNTTRECFVGPAVRLGLEGANTPHWCEPFAPTTWNGHRLKSKINGKCEWGERIPNQCFGLGPERLDTKNQRLDINKCAEACCQSNECNMWQELPNRGCYFGSSNQAWCDKPRTAFDGGRKCIPGFCGGLEDQILNHHKISQR